MRDGYALTLWTWFQLQRREKMQALLREHERIDVAGMIAMAFHDPKQLGSVERRFIAKVHDANETPASRAQWKDQALMRLRRLQTLRPVPVESDDA